MTLKSTILLFKLLRGGGGGGSLLYMEIVLHWPSLFFPVICSKKFTAGTNVGNLRTFTTNFYNLSWMISIIYLHFTCTRWSKASPLNWQQTYKCLSLFSSFKASLAVIFSVGRWALWTACQRVIIIKAKFASSCYFVFVKILFLTFAHF